MNLLSDSSILRELKLQTAVHHRRLETEADIWPSLSSRTGYRDLIVRMFAVYAALESRLKRVGDLTLFLPDLQGRWKTPTLRTDLATLGVFSNSVAACNDSVEIGSVASAFGCLYVLEGSTLGGQVISRQVHAKLGLTPERGCAFFSSYGPRVGQMWTVFGDRLESFCSSHPPCRDEIVQTALATFEYFTRQLARNKIGVTTRCV